MVGVESQGSAVVPGLGVAPPGSAVVVEHLDLVVAPGTVAVASVAPGREMTLVGDSLVVLAEVEEWGVASVPRPREKPKVLETLLKDLAIPPGGLVIQVVVVELGALEVASLVAPLHPNRMVSLVAALAISRDQEVMDNRNRVVVSTNSPLANLRPHQQVWEIYKRML